MTDQEKIDKMAGMLTRLKKHVGLFLGGEISELLQQVNDGRCECQSKSHSDQLKCRYSHEHYHNDNIYCTKPNQ